MISPWPTWLDEVWAKSPQKEDEPGEGLALHTWQVLQQLAGMIALRPRLPAMVGLPALWHILFWACWLHDFGKAATGFQQWLRGAARWPYRHEVLSLAFIDWLERAFAGDELPWLAAAIVYHHKDADEIALLYADVGGYGVQVLHELVAGVPEAALRGLWHWLEACGVAWIETLGVAAAGVRPPPLVPVDEALSRFYGHGADSIRRRLRALRRWEREVNRAGHRDLIVAALALRGHLITCDHSASAHAGARPTARLPTPDELLRRWQLPPADLYPHQAACCKVEGSAVLVAPTGSGKTEAALLWACAQGQKATSLPRLFYTLPYQASMNAMYDRLEGRCFPGQVGLEHSRSLLALYRRLLGDDYDRRQAARTARWTKELSRLYYFPVRVLSPYQILKGPYQLKGYEALLTDCLGAAFVFDEIHAYEVDRLAAILATIRYLRESFGACFLVMSATLPGLIVGWLAEALGEFTTIRATPEVFARFQRHRLLIKDGDLLEKRWLEEITREALGGKSILVCCNTVGRAQQAYVELKSRLDDATEVILLHGRFNGRDRLAKEKAIQAATGSHSCARRPVLVVATQVVEVSLDIDLEILYSDPAPLEALIQRFGRINRRRRKAWAPVNVFTQPADGQRVYPSDLVGRALEVLARNADKLVNEEEIPGWLDQIYAGHVADRLEAAYRQEYEKFTIACLRSLQPFRASSELEEMFYQAFDSVDVLPACLAEEYKGLMERGEPLEAVQLLVPLPWPQFCRLRQEGTVREDSHGWVRMVEVPYGDELGLAL